MPAVMLLNPWCPKSIYRIPAAASFGTLADYKDDNMIVPLPLQFDLQGVLSQQHGHSKLVNIATHLLGHIDAIYISDGTLIGMYTHKHEMQEVQSMDGLHLGECICGLQQRVQFGIMWGSVIQRLDRL